MDSEKIYSSWEEVCNHVKKFSGIDKTQINAFFSRLQPQAMSEGFLMLTADNDFIKTWIERHYMDFIKQALSDLYQIPYTVDITVENFETANGQSPEKKQGPQHTEERPLETQQAILEQSLPEEDSLSQPLSSLTFENFVIGDSNRMAYYMAVKVAETPGKSQINPFFIYGRSGLGKTHLLRAIQNYLHETFPNLKTVYVDSAELLNDYMEASSAHDKEKTSFKNFKTRYEEADVLLIDDVQYLQGKTQTLDNVFQIFNKLMSQGKQVVLSADRAPKNIDIDERYTSRFSSGGPCEIYPPEIETKLGIVKNFIDEYREAEGRPNLTVSEDIQIYIAESSGSNIRELKSAVTKVIYQMLFFNQQNISLDDVRRLLENHFSGGASKKLTAGDIQKAVEEYYKVTHSELLGKKRNTNIAYPRQIAIYLCRHLLDLPYSAIGNKFNRDHSTVMYSFTLIEEKIKESRELREDLEILLKMIRES